LLFYTFLQTEKNRKIQNRNIYQRNLTMVRKTNSVIFLCFVSLVSYGSQESGGKYEDLEKVYQEEVKLHKNIKAQKEQAKQRRREKRERPKRLTFNERLKKYEKEYKESRKLKKRQKEEVKNQLEIFNAYHKTNETKYGKTNWGLLNNICASAAEIIEHRKKGITSIWAGSDILEKLSEALQEYRDLDSLETSQKKSIQTKLQKVAGVVVNYKSRLKEMKIKKNNSLIKNLSAVSSKNGELGLMIINASKKGTRCESSGFSAQGAVILGGRFSAHKLKCKTPLGRRILYGHTSAFFSLGIGGFVSKSMAGYERDKDGQLQKQTVPYPRAKITGDLGVSVAAGVGVQCNTSSVDGVSYGVGLGIFESAGASGFIKIKNLRHDFREVFGLLNIIKKD
jgi:hypothetical protein